MIVGERFGSQYKMPTSSGSNVRHNKESITCSWQQVGDKTGTSWKVKADMYQGHELTEN